MPVTPGADTSRRVFSVEESLSSDRWTRLPTGSEGGVLPTAGKAERSGRRKERGEERDAKVPAAAAAGSLGREAKRGEGELRTEAGPGWALTSARCWSGVVRFPQWEAG